MEINIIPMMNLLCILIPFLLLSASFVTLTMIETSLPARAKSVASDEPIPEPEQKLTLTLNIQEEGFILAGAGGILHIGAAAEGEEGASPEIMIKKKRQQLTRPDGKELFDENGAPEMGMDYDWRQLKEYLIEIKKVYPNQYTIILMPVDTIKYEIIVRVMDTARYYKPEGKDELEYLFPNATMSLGKVRTSG